MRWITIGMSSFVNETEVPEAFRGSVDSSGQGILHIDIDGIPFPSRFNSSTRLVESLVSRELRKPEHERIDNVIISSTAVDELLDNIVRPLADLQPKTLQIYSGIDEDCLLSSIAAPSVPPQTWARLRALRLVNICGLSEEKDWPGEVMENIQDLSFHFCHALACKPSKPIKALTRLTIYENNATDMFNFLVDNNPAAFSTLQSLDLTTTNGCDIQHEYGRTAFTERLGKCRALTSLKLKLGGSKHDVGLAPHLPPSLEYLSFSGPCTTQFYHDLDSWIQEAKKKRWLPKLKKFELGWLPQSRGSYALFTAINGEGWNVDGDGDGGDVGDGGGEDDEESDEHTEEEWSSDEQEDAGEVADTNFLHGEVIGEDAAAADGSEWETDGSYPGSERSWNSRHYDSTKISLAEADAKAEILFQILRSRLKNPVHCQAIPVTKSTS